MRAIWVHRTCLEAFGGDRGDEKSFERANGSIISQIRGSDCGSTSVLGYRELLHNRYSIIHSGGTRSRSRCDYLDPR